MEVIRNQLAGSPFEISMRELAEYLVVEMGLRPVGKAHELVEFVQDRNINDRRYAINDAKLKELGWKPEEHWEHGIRGTIEWYRHLPVSARNQTWSIC